jgi:hypothetical protein
MLYSTEAVGRRVPDVRAGLRGSVRATVAGAVRAACAPGSAAYEGRPREQAPLAAEHPRGNNTSRAPPAAFLSRLVCGAEKMLGRCAASAQPSATTTWKQMIVMSTMLATA